MEKRERSLSARRPATSATRFSLLLLLALLAVGPLLFLLLLSLGDSWFWPVLVPDGLSLDAWATLASGAVGVRLVEAAANSILLGVSTGLLASLIALPLGRQLARLRGWRRAIGSAAAFLPVAAPPVSLGVGLHFTFLVGGLGGTLTGVLLAHLIPALGYTSLFFMGYFEVYDDRLDEAALTLGASRVQLFRRVTLPILRRPLIEAALLGFLVSWAQVPLTLLIGQGLVSTLPVELLTYVGAGQDRLAAAGALILTLPALLALGLAGLATRRTEVVVA